MILKRKVKGKVYFYLEQSVRLGKQVKKFSEYIGSQKPSKPELTNFEKKLSKKVQSFYVNELLKPKTEFITVKSAKELERIKQETQKFLDNLSEKQKKNWVEQEREKFITNTNAIEGSTLTLDETKRILKLNEKIGSDRERLEVLNMERCLKQYDILLLKKSELNEQFILNLHYVLLDQVENYDNYKGIWRPVNVYIKTSKFDFPHFSYVPSMMKKLIEWYAENKQIIHPVELAAKFHTKFTSIHPFADGNGRIARLLMNYILQVNGFPFANIPVEKRTNYFNTQEKGHTENYKEFTLFLKDQLKENYKQIKKNNKKGS